MLASDVSPKAWKQNAGENWEGKRGRANQSAVLCNAVEQGDQSSSPAIHKTF